MGELFIFDDAKEELIADDSPQLSDHVERAQALDTTRSWVVEAPAGSGKTGLLIQRYLKLLSDPQVEQPEQILAITFTLKAAGEIRDRVLKQLSLAASDAAETSDRFAIETRQLAAAALARDRKMGWGLLEDPRRLNLRTIDSVCAEIARGLPILSGGSGLSPVDNASALHRLAAERTLLQLGSQDHRLSDALRLILLHRDGDLQRCRDLIAEMLALRDQWGRLVPLDRNSLEDSFLDGKILPEIERTLADAICEELHEVESAFPRRQLEKLAHLAAEMSSSEGYKGQLSPIAACSGRYTPPVVTADALGWWKSIAHLLVKEDGEWRAGFNINHVQFAIEKHHVKELRSIVDSLRGDGALLEILGRVRHLPPTIYPDDQWRVTKALFHVLYRGLAELQIVFAERGECDFTELGLLARAALNQGGGVIDTAVGAKLQHLLIDEMQDTSTSQYELIQLLIQEWDGRSQTVFLVGDPKQSIYLFRQARVERFIRMMQEHQLGGVELGLLKLRANFRSQPGLVASFNDTFSRVFPGAIDERRPEEAPYVTAEPVRPAQLTDSEAAFWHAEVVDADSSAETTADTSRLDKLESLKVRKIIEHWRAKPLPEGRVKPWKIAVLVRNRKHLAQIVPALKHRDGSGPIPFRAVNIESLSERSEVLDLFALTRALLHPADRVAWLSVLRAPWCGLELTDLHRLSGEDDNSYEQYTIPELMQLRAGLLSSAGAIRLERIAPILATAKRQLGRVSLPELVERTWRSVGGDQYLSREEERNAERYLELLDEIELQGSAIDLELIKRQLNDLYAAAATDEDAVDLMTIHGAKGLEWDVVLLPGLDKRTQGDAQRLLVWDELNSNDTTSSRVLLSPMAGKGQDSEALNLWLRGIHRRRQNAECKRLFYVACTRAREELHLFATVKRSRNGLLEPIKGTLLDAAWPAVKQQFVDQDAQANLNPGRVVPFPALEPDRVLASLAAEVAPRSSYSKLYRLPTEAGLSQRTSAIVWQNRYATANAVLFDRPEGSFAARALGTTIHAFLEMLARRIAMDEQPGSLLNEIPQWRPRIAAVLRSHGLPPSGIEQMANRVQSALETTLGDRDGQWILNCHKDAVSEQALTAWDSVRATVRMDRVFRAGSTPHGMGDDYLWIVDFKTALYTGSVDDVESFLQGERQKYAAQLETYARALRQATTKDNVRLGLYYPSLPRLTWWSFRFED
jgi:ATP-dependent exoDNAse (exonuclease V) beta subunit